MSLPEPIRQRIQSTIDENKVVLFMKGNVQMPQCGFSARTVQALQTVGVEFTTVDVLGDPEIRQGIKDFSEWPTIPQLYIDQEFIGGCDIVSQMFSSGELHEALGKEYVPPKPPELHLSESFLNAIRGASAGARGLPRIQVSPSFEYGIGFSPEGPGDLKVEVGGLTFLVDPSSAERADGLRIDFQEGEGGGVIIDNPNEPASVKQLPVHALKQMMDSGRPLHLFDVRTAEERQTARIEPSTHLDAEGAKVLADLPEEAMIVFYCHHGIRSHQAASQALAQGYRNVYNMDGGIDAWSVHVDTSVARY
jgi:monothiol glutaredoxin